MPKQSAMRSIGISVLFCFIYVDLFHDPRVDQSKIEEDHKWVQNSYSPYGIFEAKWISTIHMRLKPLHDNGDLQIHEYLEKYPVYKIEISATVVRKLLKHLGISGPVWRQSYHKIASRPSVNWSVWPTPESPGQFHSNYDLHRNFY